MKNFRKTSAHFFPLALIISLFLLRGCGSDDVVNPPNPNEEELITTLIINLTDSVTLAQTSFQFDDPDGEGGNPPTRFDTILIGANRTYFAQIILLNKSVTPVDTISNEVLEEGADHQFFFTTTDVSTVISYADADINGNPIGLETLWRDGAASNGNILVVLKHQPGTKAPAPGNPAIGETDVQVDFITRVQ
ncbi:MAG: hypothetical protein IPG02_16175 [Ignavibacteria bacterium]|nr:hypothetical protein [Ignavibacteria bacterium]